jgi:hypothetical protein
MAENNNVGTLVQMVQALLQAGEAREARAEERLARTEERHAEAMHEMMQDRIRREQGDLTAKDLARLALDMKSKCATFERGKDRWFDFEQLIRMEFRRQRIPDDLAKEVLWGAIVGKSSRIVIASMNPVQQKYQAMTFDQYIAEMAGKFTPASESIQMKSEYKSRKQGKMEDVQNYINEKYELYKMAYPHANAADMSDFYMEATKGVANRYVRSNLWAFEATSVEQYGQKAVFLAQVERQRIAYGDSDSTNMDGLVSVTKTMNVQPGAEAMEVDHLKAEVGEEDDEIGECECMALHEQGFRGPCYYCQRRGHMMRNCPRKSAGLPKVRTAGQGPSNTGRKWTPANKTQGGTKAREGTAYQKRVYPSAKRVNQVEEEDDEEERGATEETIEAEDEVGFLGETL